MNLVPRRCTNFSGPLWGTNLIVFLFSIIPSKRLFNFNLQAIFCHFFYPPNFLSPVAGYPFGIPFGVPIWSLSLLLYLLGNFFFLGFNLKPTFAHFCTLFFFNWRMDGWWTGRWWSGKNHVFGGYLQNYSIFFPYCF